jgi:hypothetical protein
MRWHADDLSRIDAYGRAKGIERTEAIRELVRLGLQDRSKPTPAGRKRER